MFVLPGLWLGALGSLLKVEHPLVALAISPLVLAGALALAYWIHAAHKSFSLAAMSTRPVPRLLYGLAGLCFFALAVGLARLSFAQSHAGGNAAFSITLGFLALYCAIGATLNLGRALTWGRSRLIFWIFLPRWLGGGPRPGQSTPATRGHRQARQALLKTRHRGSPK